MPEKSSADGLVVDILVEQPGGDCNRYAYDEHAHVIRLAEVLHVGARVPIDRGSIPNTLTPEGEPVPVVLLVTQHVFPGAHVQARPLALAESEDGSFGLIVAVPAVDPSLHEHRDASDLDDAARQAIAALHRAPSLRWQPASAAIDYIRMARERAAWARREAAKGQRPGRSWQADRLVGSGRASDVYTAAERDLRALPARFQRYVADCLFADERILLFVTRPPMPAESSGLPFWRSRRLPDGLLVVTDRQILWMVDAMPPDATMVQWGYVAQIGAIERLSAVTIDRHDDRLYLTITWTARGGAEVLAIPFPNDRCDLLVDATHLLDRFIPRPPTRAVRRIYQLDPEVSPIRASERRDEDDADPTREQLRAAALNVLCQGEAVAAMAYIPSGHHRPIPRLLLATNHRVIIVADQPAAAPVSWSVAELTSLTLRNSLVSCYLEFVHSTGGSLERTSVPFDYPQRDAILEVFSAVRRVLGQPFGIIPLAETRAASRRE